MSKKSSLEMTILAAQKALQKLVDENPKSGVRVEQGTAAESKIRNAEALTALKRLNWFFRDNRTMEFGVCDSCAHFTRKGHSSVDNSFGSCTSHLGKRGTLHCYDSCKEHSERLKPDDKV